MIAQGVVPMGSRPREADEVFMGASIIRQLSGLLRRRGTPPATEDRPEAELLHQQSLRLDVALNTMVQGLIMFDAFERVVLYNRRYLEISGLSADFLRPGRTLREILEIRKAQGSFHNDIDQYRHELLTAVARGDTKRLLMQTDDGRVCQVVNVPMAGGGWVATHEDITEQVTAKRLIETQKLQLDTALENMSQGLCMFDADARLITCNRKYAEIYRLTEDLIRPGTPFEVILRHQIIVGNVPDWTKADVDLRLERAARRQPYETTNRLRDGVLIYVLHRPMPGGGWVTTHEDVTEARRREDSF